nr:MAG TPA: hypothetical protein [Caudoviricetes sp.]
MLEGLLNPKIIMKGGIKIGKPRCDFKQERHAGRRQN